MALFGRKRPRSEFGLDGRAAELGLSEGDILILEQLRKVGADLRNPRHVIYYSYFKDKDIAEAASREAADRGFEVSVRPPLPQYPEDWALVCERRDVVLGLEDIRDNSILFETLAATHGGVFDGWEASAS